MKSVRPPPLVYEFHKKISFFTMDGFLYYNWIEIFSEYEFMPYGRRCPPGRDFNEDDCRKLDKLPSLKFSGSTRLRDYLPKCFFYNKMSRVFYNRGGRLPPTRTKYGHKAICKKKRTSTTTTTTTTSLPPGDLSHTWSISSKTITSSTNRDDLIDKNKLAKLE